MYKLIMLYEFLVLFFNCILLFNSVDAFYEEVCNSEKGYF